MPDTSRTQPSSATRAEEARDARVASGPAPTEPGADERAPEPSELDPDVASHYEEMIERGAEQRGEGRVP